MPGHDDVIVFRGASTDFVKAARQETEALRPFTCGSCGRAVQGALLARAMNDGRTWLMCTSCGAPSVIDAMDRQTPAPLAGAAVPGLPNDVEQAWQEARLTVGMGAHTAGALLCRKILMHVAVDVANAKAGLTFQEYITKLEKAGYVTPPMKPWVDIIRDLGNDATHKLPQIEPAKSLSVLMFTEQLLLLSYGMTHLTGQFAPPPLDDDVEADGDDDVDVEP